MYNYKKFSNKEYDLTFSTGSKVGEIIPDFTILTLPGKTSAISDYFDKPVVLETGSITCGMFAGQGEAMNKLAGETPEFNFLLLYVREAHPGKKIAAHHTIQEKQELAQRLYNQGEIENRTIIIDDLDGTAHQALGALPNMVFIISTNGEVVFKEEWNNAKSVKAAIEKFKAGKQSIPEKWTMLPFPDIPVEYRVFKRAGWDAAIDFISALPKLIYTHIIAGLCRKYPRLCKR